MSPARRPSNRCMPVAEWPPLDRAAWTAALASEDGPDQSSIAAHWSARTRRHQRPRTLAYVASRAGQRRRRVAGRRDHIGVPRTVRDRSTKDRR